MAEQKLVGQNYSTPDLRAKVTGRAKYAEDFRAPGMLFARLLLSPYPARARQEHRRERGARHARRESDPDGRRCARCRRIRSTTHGQVIKANPKSEKALTNEPLYQGEPVLAVAAVDELTAAEAIEKIEIQWEPLPFSVDPVASLLPGAMNPRVEGNVWIRPTADAGPAAAASRSVQDLKWTRGGGRGVQGGPSADGQGHRSRVVVGDVEAGFKKASLILDETFVTPNTSHQCLESRTSMAYWQNGKLYIHLSTQSVVQTVMSVVRWLDLKPENVVLVSEYCGGGYGSKGDGVGHRHHPRAAVQEDGHAGA